MIKIRHLCALITGLLCLYSQVSTSYQILEPSKPGSQREWWADHDTQRNYKKYKESQKYMNKQKHNNLIKYFLKNQKEKGVTTHHEQPKRRL